MCVLISGSNWAKNKNIQIDFIVNLFFASGKSAYEYERLREKEVKKNIIFQLIAASEQKTL